MKILNDLVIHEIDSCKSTQELLHSYTSTNPNQAQIIIANEQTQGKGQTNKSWISPKDLGWYFSFYLPNLQIPAHQLQCIGWIVAISLIDALKQLNIFAEAKWPNDIYTSKGKLAGMLIENHMAAKSIKSVTIGIGINSKPFLVNNLPFLGVTNLEAELADSNAPLPSKFDFIFPLIQNIKNELNQPLLNLQDIHQSFLKYSFGINRYFTFERNGNKLKGRLQTIDSSGAMILDTCNGTEKIYSGAIKWIDYA